MGPAVPEQQGRLEEDLKASDGIGTVVSYNACMMRRFAMLTVLSVLAAPVWAADLPSLPPVLDCRLEARRAEPNSNEWVVTCTVVAAVDRTALKVVPSPSAGVTLVARPDRLKGRLPKGRTATFTFRCRVTDGGDAIRGLNVNVRYRLPLAGLRGLSTDAATLAHLDGLEGSGDTIRTLHRGVLLAGEVRHAQP